MDGSEFKKWVKVTHSLHPKEGLKMTFELVGECVPEDMVLVVNNGGSKIARKGDLPIEMVITESPGSIVVMMHSELENPLGFWMVSKLILPSPSPNTLELVAYKVEFYPPK